jgi:hypothetical protein
MTAQIEGFDPIGPGTPAWDASADTITHEINGRHDEAKASRDKMVRELLANGASASLIRQWEDFIAGRVANPEPDDFD